MPGFRKRLTSQPLPYKPSFFIKFGQILFDITALNLSKYDFDFLHTNVLLGASLYPAVQDMFMCRNYEINRSKIFFFLRTTTRPENSEQNRTEVQQTLPLSLIAQLRLFHPSSSNHCHFHLSNYHPHNQVRANSRKTLNNFNLERFYYLICSFPISNNIKAQISQFMKKVWMSFQKCIAAKLR